VPASVQNLRRDDVCYRPLADRGVTSPIILSWRDGDGTPPVLLLQRMARTLAPTASAAGDDGR
jgi:LysR family transcriptional regulator, benzoate and cis,cis-muconate-responsive activator of ben and cat genes